MRLTVDQEADALHFRLVDVPVSESDEISPGVIVDYDESNQVIGIEVLGLSKRRPPVNPLDFNFRVTSKMPVQTEE
jgi:uncharacterized protein YuzE